MEKDIREEWSTVTGIGWWNEGRKKLNKTIRKYNNWQTKHDFSVTKGLKLYLKIMEEKKELGDGGSGWWEELDGMSENIKSILKEKIDIFDS